MLCNIWNTTSSCSWIWISIINSNRDTYLTINDLKEYNDFSKNAGLDTYKNRLSVSKDKEADWFYKNEKFEKKRIYYC